ncbi:type-F conjugative transfer system mating-pair stabilization protein TraN [Vibrio splendidus]|uniref:type-F conjugative transfer system mating-pair stabilization protein TraN n=1 Tax=Vibrio splendidus TaxID=29497 RepID=UPI000C84824A|nr:type-F conjugative transfer system mating-pair stabilization protein TraN [Vibrio splendidus]PMP37134.1 type-F conjugative transfer system mating-pair stabilization protein TraN [Vibrio splendidus]
MKHVLLIASLAIVSGAFASQGDHYYDNVDWVKSAQKNIPSTAKGKLDVEDYCAGQGCDNDLRNPEQAQLNDGNMDANARTHYQSNDKAQAVQTRFDKGRPDVKSDPAYEFALMVQDNAYEISHGLSNQYVDCDNATQCVIDDIPKVCRQPTNNTVPCTKMPTFTAVTSPVIYSCPSGWSRHGRFCKNTRQECRYDSRNYVERSCGDFSFHWQGAGFGFWKRGHSRYRSEQGCGRENGTDYREKYEICGNIEQQVLATLSCRGGYTLSGGNCIKNTVRWTTHCNLLSECQVVSQTCVEGRGTRRINGVPTTLDCWKYQVNHQCTRDNTCNALPTDCTTTATHCSAKQKGVCIEEELKKSCPEKRCSATNLTCGEESFCLDGDCYAGTPEPSSDFNESAAALAALSKAAEGLGDPPLIFTGQGQKCTKKMLGISDCCKDGGWGTDVGLAQCSEEEKALGKAKDDKLTIYLGSYCAEKVLGQCLRKKRTYCVFDSLLARIIQEQGTRDQLGLSLGTAKVPICGAITPEQMQQINFEDIDFSDFFGEMNSNTHLPSSQEIQHRLSSALGDP